MNIPEAKRWLTYAQSDLDAAHILLQSQEGYPRQVWAIDARYPDDMPDVVEADAQEALQLAKAIHQTIIDDMEGQGVQLYD